MPNTLTFGFSNPQQYSNYQKYMGIDPQTMNFVQNNKQSPSIYSVPPNQVGPAVPNSAQAFSQSMQNAVQPVTQPITDAVNGFKSQISSGLQNAGTSLLSMIQDQF